MDFQKTALVGRIARDAEVKTTASGDVLEFTVAVNLKKKGVESVAFHSVSQWGPPPWLAKDPPKKGDMVFVEGPFVTEAYTAKDGSLMSKLNITAKEVNVLSRPTAS